MAGLKKAFAGKWNLKGQLHERGRRRDMPTGNRAVQWSSTFLVFRFAELQKQESDLNYIRVTSQKEGQN